MEDEETMNLTIHPLTKKQRAQYPVISNLEKHGLADSETIFDQISETGNQVLDKVKEGSNIITTTRDNVLDWLNPERRMNYTPPETNQATAWPGGYTSVNLLIVAGIIGAGIIAWKLRE